MLKACSPDSSLKYSLGWAWSIVHKFQDKYPRATSAVDEIYGLEGPELADWLAKGLPRWPNYRTAVKIWFEWNKRSPFDVQDPELHNMRLVHFKNFIKGKRFPRYIG
ncbi:unnamed protein product [marine sediment metagenome]|uniref:Uncharacterized protein n=1 Tax=marine sediment metagenome TaxID=412755 RepID=X1DQW5_9ZZZZ